MCVNFVIFAQEMVMKLESVGSMAGTMGGQREYFDRRQMSA